MIHDKYKFVLIRGMPPFSTTWADQSDPRLSGGVRELNNTPIERGWVYSQLRERGVNNRVNKDVDHDFCSHHALTELCLHPIALNRRVV